MRPLIITFSLLLMISAPPTRAAEPSAESPNPTGQEQLEKMRMQIEAVDREVIILKQVTDSRLDAQDKRIGDFGALSELQGNHMAGIANVTTWVGILITLIAIAAGFIIYLSMDHRAKTESEKAAKQWFQHYAEDLRLHIEILEKEANALQLQIDILRNKAHQAHENINRTTTDIDAHAEKSLMTIEQATLRILAAADIDQDSRLFDPAAVEAVEHANRALESKPEIAFTADDYFARGMSDYLSENYLSALENFERSLVRAREESVSSERLARFLLLRGVALGKLGHHHDAIAVNDEVDHRYGNEEGFTLREQVAKALFNKGVAFSMLGQHGDAVAAYEEIDRRYGLDEDQKLRDVVAKALFNKGVSLERIERREEEILTYDAIDERYGADMSEGMKEQVAKALFNKGIVLSLLERRIEAIAVYESIDARYGIDPNPALREQVAKAIFNKGTLMTALGHIKEAFDAYNTIDQRYGADIALREVVCVVLACRGFSHLLYAKQNWPNEMERHERLSMAINDFRRAHEHCASDDRPMLHGNLGYALFLYGAVEEAMSHTRQCLDLGLENSLISQHMDAKLHRVEPQDTEYEQLLDRLWGEISGQT